MLLDYLVKNGSERVITTTREHLYDMRALEHYTHIDEKGKDQGINVRQRAKDLLALVNDDSHLRDERKKAKKNRDKYVGVGSEGKGPRPLIGKCFCAYMFENTIFCHRNGYLHRLPNASTFFKKDALSPLYRPIAF